MPLSKAANRERMRQKRGTNNPQADTNKKVYFIEDRTNKAFKVGISIYPHSRLEALQAGNPNVLVLGKVIENGTPQLERKLQGLYESDWLRGEWFRYYQKGDVALVREGQTVRVECNTGALVDYIPMPQ